jgi:hypothetical protein
MAELASTRRQIRKPAPRCFKVLIRSILAEFAPRARSWLGQP